LVAVKLPEVVCTRLETESAADLRRLASLGGRTIAEELRAMIRSRLLEAHLQGLFPGERPSQN
jgi:hypothetical protein